jgi:hypothetical protein
VSRFYNHRVQAFRLNDRVIIHRERAVHNRLHSMLAAVVIGAATCAANAASAPAGLKDNPMREHITGRFDVKLIPQENRDDPSGVAHLLLDKTFHGALEATSRGHMLALRTANGTSGGYVAMEKVSGTLQGRSGTFHLQHYGLATRGVNTLTLQVVPDSGTADLEGLTGTMTIEVKEGGEHFYVFEFEVESKG